MGFEKGYTPWNKGKKHSEEIKNRISKSLKMFYLSNTHPCTEESRKKISLKLSGNNNALGHRKSEEVKKTISKKSEGRIAWNKGIHHTKIMGENHHNWKGGVEKQKLGGHTLEWKLWRADVFERDDYTCQMCGGSGCYLEPHHILPKRKYEEKIYNVTNGITLCRPCHIMTMGKEDLFAEKFSALTMPQV